MIGKKTSLLSLVVFGVFYATIACGDTYRCLNSEGQLEYTNRPCASDGSLTPLAPAPAPAPAAPDIAEVDSSSTFNRSDGSTCPMILAPKPEPSGSGDYRAQQLDRLEARLYGDARAGRIRWTQLVDQFYSECARLYPGYHTNHLVEVSTYQRVLAEKMDKRHITESEWIYLLEAQAADIRERRAIIENSRQPSIIIDSRPPPSPIHRSTNCTTTEFMGTYRTTCD